MSRKGRGAACARFGALAAWLLGAASCDQGEGDRCEVTSDCESGLRCDLNQNICVPEMQPAADAFVPVPVSDAGARDAFSFADTASAIDAAAAADAILSDAPVVDAPVIVPDAAAPDAASD